MVTERVGKRLIRVNSETGDIKTAYEFDIPDVLEGAQSGVMGFAFHPDFGNGTDQIFVVHTYEDADRTDPSRNAQGIAVAPDRTIYSNEHGPSSDDEINVIVAGGNYGWPQVAGFADDSHYAYGIWSVASVDVNTLEFNQPENGFPDEVPVKKESEWAGLADMKTPLATLFTLLPTRNTTSVTSPVPPLAPRPSSSTKAMRFPS